MKTLPEKILHPSIFRSLGFAIFILLTGLYLCTCEKAPAQESENSEITHNIVESNSLQKSLPKLLDLGAKECIPCKKMAPILDEMEEEYKKVLDVEFVDVWQPENKERALKHKIKVIPTQIFFDARGKELWRHIGFISKEDMLKKWRELGYDFQPAS